MANFREVLEIALQTQGEASIKQLVRTLAELGKTGEITDEQLSGLLEELNNTTAAQKAVSNFARLKAEVTELAPKLAAAKTRAAELGREIAASEKPTNAQSAAFEKAKREASGLEQQHIKLNRQLNVGRTEVQRYGISTTELGTAQGQLRQRAQAVEAEMRKLATTAGQAARENAASARSTQGLGEAAERSASRIERLGTALKAMLGAGVAFLGLRKLKDTLVEILTVGDRFEGLETRLKSAFGSADAGAVAFAKLRDLAQRVPDSLESITDAALKLRSFGLDPLDGSLEALINQNANLGGSQETLNGLILATGQAWAKQKLQGEEILQLVERGVPVWDLLAKATGKNVQELQRLSERGELGRETIAKLLAEIGKANDGAAAEGVNRLSSLWTKFRDIVADFFNRIADSGPLDFFKTQLATLQDRIRQMAQDGSLQALAERVGGAIVSLANGVKTVVGGLASVAGAIVNVASAIKNSIVGESIGEVAKALTAMAAGARDGVVWLFESGKGILGLGENAAEADAVLRSTTAALAGLTTATESNREANLKAAQAALDVGEATLALRETYLQDAEAELARAKAKVETLGFFDQERLAVAQRIGSLENEITILQQSADRQREANVALEEAINATAIAADMQARLADAATKTNEALAAQAAQVDGAAIKAMQDLGVSAEVVGNNFTEAGRKTLDALAAIGASAKTTSGQMSASFDAALSKLSTSAELGEFRDQLTRAFEDGRLSSDRYAALMVQVTSRTLEVKNAAAQARGEIEAGGRAGEEASRRRIAALENERQKLATLAAEISSKITEALKSGADEDTLQGLRDQFNAVHGQISGLNSQFQNTKSELQAAGEKGKQAGQQIGQGMQQAGAAADQAGENVAGAFDRVGAAQALRDAITAVSEEFFGLSEAAGKAFEQMLLDFAKGERTILGVFNAINQAQAETRAAYQAQQEAAARQAEGLANLSEDAIERMVRTGVTADSLRANAGRLTEIFDLLGDQDLSGLRSALNSAASQVDSLRNKAEGALEALQRMNDELEAERLRAEGNEEALAQRERDRRLEQIQEELEAAGAAGAQLAARNRELAEEAFQRRLREIEEERRRRIATEDEVADRRRGNENAGGGRGGGAGAAAGAGRGGVLRVELATANDQGSGGRTQMSDADLERIAQRVIGAIEAARRVSL